VNSGYGRIRSTFWLLRRLRLQKQEVRRTSHQGCNAFDVHIAPFALHPGGLAGEQRSGGAGGDAPCLLGGQDARIAGGMALGEGEDLEVGEQVKRVVGAGPVGTQPDPDPGFDGTCLCDPTLTVVA